MSNSGDFRCINMMDIIIDEEARSFSSKFAKVLRYYLVNNPGAV